MIYEKHKEFRKKLEESMTKSESEDWKWHLSATNLMVDLVDMRDSYRNFADTANEQFFNGKTSKRDYLNNIKNASNSYLKHQKGHTKCINEYFRETSKIDSSLANPKESYNINNKEVFLRTAIFYSLN